MSEMAQVVDRDSAAVDACFARRQWSEGLDAASECIGEPQVQRFWEALEKITASEGCEPWTRSGDCSEFLQHYPVFSRG